MRKSKAPIGKETIQLLNINKIYGEKSSAIKVHALKNVNLMFRTGKIYAIMGHSGSGKSTLMHIIGLLDKPTSGQFMLNGSNVSNFSENDIALQRSREIGFVFQAFNLLPRYSVYKNVEMPLMYSHTEILTKHEREERIEKLLGRVGLAKRAKHKPSELSGGEKQRVAIARSLVNNPSIILADEPTGNLDTKTEREIMNLFSELKNENRTIILVTHDDVVAEYADEIVMIKDGEVVS